MAHDFSPEDIAQGATEQAVLPHAVATRAERGVGEALDAARLRALAALPGQIVWRADVDGLIKDDVSAWCAVIGQTPDAARGWSWTFAVHPEDRERAVAAWSAALARPGPFEQAMRIRRADGQYRHFFTRAAPVEVDGAVCEWIGVSTDVTEQVEAEATRAQLEAIFDAITDGIYVYDRAGHVIRASAAAQRLNLLLGQAEYLAKDLEERSTPLAVEDERGHPLAAGDMLVARVLRGEALTGAWAVDTSMRRPDGSELLLNTTGAPVCDRAGGIQGAVIVTRDVTERQRLERGAHEALDALLAMAALLVAPAGAVDGASGETGDLPGAAEAYDAARLGQRLAELTRRVLGCERVALLAATRRGEPLRPLAAVGISAAEEQRWRVGDAEGGYLRQRLPAELARRLQAGELLLLDYTRPPFSELPNPHGLRVLLLAPLLAGGELVGLLNIDHGGQPHTYTEEELRLAGAVTQLAALVVERERLVRERAEAQASALALEQANRRMDEFLSIASHELRTPLTIFKANLQIVERRLQRLAVELGGDGPLGARLTSLEDLLARAEMAAGRQERLVNDLLDVSRIQTGKLELRLEGCDLAAIVREGVEEQRLANPERAILLEGAEAPVPVEVDADRIGQVVTNYLTNALKYSATDRLVMVTLRREPAWVRVAVHDEGPGLPAEEREQVWERFHRVAGVEHLNGSGVGLGLGLYICREIVERHGGQVGVESAMGAGSTFWFTLPLHAKPGA